MENGPFGYVKLANTWVIVNEGGGPTEDKPDVTLVPPSDPEHASSFMNIRVADIQAKYKEWKSKGAEFFDAPYGSRHGNPLLHARSRRVSYRGRPGDRDAESF